MNFTAESSSQSCPGGTFCRSARVNRLSMECSLTKMRAISSRMRVSQVLRDVAWRTKTSIGCGNHDSTSSARSGRVSLSAGEEGEDLSLVFDGVAAEVSAAGFDFATRTLGIWNVITGAGRFQSHILSPERYVVLL